MSDLHLTFVFFYATIISCFAQKGPNVEWSKLYGGSDAEIIQTMESLPHGGYIAAGYTASINGDIQGKEATGIDWWIVELDHGGHITRQAVYGSKGTDVVYRVLPLEEGGYIVNGTVSSEMDLDFEEVSGKGGTDILIAKLNDTLGIEWIRNYGGSGNEALYDMKKTTDGGYIACGYTSSQDGDVKSKQNGANDDWWIVKFDAQFNIQYEKTFGGSGPASALYHECAYSVIQLHNGNYALAGITSSVDGDLTNSGIDKNDATVLILNETLGSVWSKTFGGGANDVFHNIIQLSDGNLVVAGQTLSSDGTMDGMVKGGSDIWIMKVSPDDGVIHWSELLGGTGNERSVAVSETLLETMDHEILYVGLTNKADGDVSKLRGGDNAGYDAWMVNLNNAGTIQWEKTFGGPTGNGTSFDYVNKVIGLGDGGFMLAGRSNSGPGGDITTNNGNYDAWFMKLSPCPERVSQSASVCENEAYDFNGTMLTAAGEYRDTLLTAGGCDSIITLTLHHHPAYTTVRDKAVCEGETYDFYGQSLSEAGSYIHVLKSVAGCDSTISLRFTVNTLPAPEIVAEENSLGTGSYTQYEWLYNDSPTGSSDAVYQADRTGYYQVAVTDENGCRDTSEAVFVGIPSEDAFALEGRYIWKFAIPGMGDQVSAQEYHADRIDYRMAGNAYTNDYSMSMESYDAEEGRWIGVGSGGSSIVKDGIYYVLFFREYRGDSVLVYKRECESREDAYTFAYPAEDATSDHGWNWYVRDPGTGLYSPGVLGRVNLYPNPVQSALEIRHPFTGLVSIRLLDTYGRVVVESENQEYVDMSGYSSGVYLLQIYENSILQYTERIIKR